MIEPTNARTGQLLALAKDELPEFEDKSIRKIGKENKKMATNYWFVAISTIIS